MSVKHLFVNLMVLPVLLACNYSFAESNQCETGVRFQFITTVDQLRTKLGLSSKSDQIAIEVAQLNYESATRAVDETTVSASYQSRVGRDGDLNTQSRAESSNELSASIDLTPYRVTLEKAERSLDSQVKFLAYQQQVQETKYRVLKTLIQIAEVSAILQNYELELQIAMDRLSFYQKRRDLGETVQVQLADFTTRVREASDKQKSAEVRRVSLASTIGLTPDSFSALPKWEVNLESFEPRYCDFRTFDIASAELDLRSARNNLDRARTERLPSISGVISISQERARRTEALDSEVALSLSLPLYAGGSLSNRQRDADQQLTLAQRRVKLTQDLSREQFLRQYSVEQIFFQSLSGQFDRLSGVRQKITELLQRKKMGQSVYEELSDNMIEELKTREAITRLQSEALLNWLDFMVDKHD